MTVMTSTEKPAPIAPQQIDGSAEIVFVGFAFAIVLVMLALFTRPHWTQERIDEYNES